MASKKPSAKLGKLIDDLHEARQTRLAAQRELDALKEDEHAREQRVLAELQKAGLEKAAGQHASVSIKINTVGQVAPDEWGTVHAYIKRTGSFDLLQKRLNNAAVRERVEAGEEIPGVKTVQILDLSVRGL